jgi:Ni,Fe-hydrogenase III large subunit
MLAELIAPYPRIEAHRPWPRVLIDGNAWHRAAISLAAGELTLIGLWGETDTVHAAVMENSTRSIAVISLDCREGIYPSLGAVHPPAIRLERAIRDLHGLAAADAPDTRPWLVHDGPYQFLPVEGDGLHQIPVGPVHAGIIEPGHFRFTANGETVVRLEERLGYVHKGIEGLMAGADLDRGAKLAGRLSGDSAVAYQWAFARAAEAALGIAPPDRAHWLRALMAELERIANHLGDVGAICNDAAFALMNSHCAVLRERVLRAADSAFGHRFMRDVIIPGGLARDIAAPGVNAIAALVKEVRRRFPPLVNLYDSTASLLDRTVGTGRLKPALARRFGAGGFVGRASGRDFDARRDCAYPPYDRLRFSVSCRDDGDVNARVWIRIREIEQSLTLIDQILAGLPDGATVVPMSGSLRAPSEGIALVEGFRGDILISLCMGTINKIERCHLRDPSWFQWPLLEAAIEGNIVADFPLCNKSFNCSYSGHDL